MNDQDNYDSQAWGQQEQENQEMNEKSSFAKNVWSKLSGVNVNGLTEKKGKLTYLSWMHAWSTLMEFYPESDYKLLGNEYFPDQTMSVGMQINVREDGQKVTRKMWLQVLDFKNKPVENPNAHDINNSRMRCLAKCVAMCGLGSYIYAGHDLPMEDDQKPVSEPRVEPEQRMNNTIKAMTDAKTIGMLQVQFSAGQKAFKNDHERLAKIVNEKEKLKLNFSTTNEKSE